MKSAFNVEHFASEEAAIAYLEARLWPDGSACPHTPQAAQRALRAIDAAPEVDRARVEMGSVEGEYLEIGTHYAHPAIKLRGRKADAEIWCWVSEGDLERFSERVKAVDVWRHKRVRARGIEYET